MAPTGAKFNFTKRRAPQRGVHKSNRPARSRPGGSRLAGAQPVSIRGGALPQIRAIRANQWLVVDELIVRTSIVPSGRSSPSSPVSRSYCPTTA